MLLFALAYLGGVLTILSPCILPILPFTFARADRPFRKNGLPLLAGMAITFALLASFATVAGPWLVRANQYGRFAALVLFLLVGLSLIVPMLADRLSRPFVQLGNRLATTAGPRSGIASSVLLGVATGLLWAPCAGPILGLILTGAAIQGANVRTSLLLLCYAAGAATSLAVALLAGARVFAALKRSLGAELWLRRGLGVAVLAGVILVALGADRGFLTRLSTASTFGLERGLLDRFPARPRENTITVTARAPGEEETGPDFSGATAWINSPPLRIEQLRGKVVLVDFWTYSCINCLRTIPFLRAWANKYKDSGLVIVGVHTPEFPFEKDLANVREAIRNLGILYPVAVDNDYEIWGAFDNEYWPAHYFIDIHGKIRHKHFGEGSTEQSERWIQELLRERNEQSVVPAGFVSVRGTGTEAAADMTDVRSPETYIGYERAEHFASPGGLKHDSPRRYAAPGSLTLNQWSLAGRWSVGSQQATSLSPGGRIRFRFHARDLHLVLGSGAEGKPIRYRVTLDGRAPGKEHGVDTDEQGRGTVTGHRLYQLIRQSGPIQDHVFEIEFSEPGVQAFAFTFG